MSKIITLMIALVALAMAPMAALAESHGGAEAKDESMQMQQSELMDLEVYSSDGQQIGTVTDVRTGMNDQVKALHVQTGAFLGLGDRTVEIGTDQFSKGENRINLTLSSEEVKGLPEATQAETGEQGDK